MSALTYDALIAELFPRLTGGIRWGLERTQRMLAGVGDPHTAFRSIHVGGTNGKGSVAAHLDSVLRADGRRTGLYTSPHLCSFRERIRIDGEPISESALLAAAAQLWPAINHEQPSFFEATTAIAFLAMQHAGVEIGVIEVGLGGRLDSTNVITPEVTVITNVSLDHVQLLGPRLEDVAREKAGIIKPGVPLVTAEQGTAAAAIFRAVAAANGAPLHVVSPPAALTMDAAGTRFLHPRTPDLELHTPLHGAHQAMNAALAVTALGMLVDPPASTAIQTGLSSVRWPGRFEVVTHAGVTWIFDVAHNVAGVDSLVQTLRAFQPAGPVVALTGVLGDKDWANMLIPLQAAADHVLLTTPPTAPADRRWDPARALEAAPSPNTRIIADFSDALCAAHALAAGGTIVVTGSFHTVGDALAALSLCDGPVDVSIPRIHLG